MPALGPRTSALNARLRPSAVWEAAPHAGKAQLRLARLMIGRGALSPGPPPRGLCAVGWRPHACLEACAALFVNRDRRAPRLPAQRMAAIGRRAAKPTTWAQRRQRGKTLWPPAPGVSVHHAALAGPGCFEARRSTADSTPAPRASSGTMCGGRAPRFRSLTPSD
jgi:hypothetical protein